MNSSNSKEVYRIAVRQGNYVFTTPPVLIKLAQNGGGAFKGKENPRFNEIRALFPFPPDHAFRS